MSKKDKEKIQEFQYAIEALERENEFQQERLYELDRRLAEKQDKIMGLIVENDRLTLRYEPYYPPGVRNKISKFLDRLDRKAGGVSFDFWPPREWFRLSIHRWNPGQYFQIYIGPFRLDWFAS